jgi:hypothetical protein
MPRIRDRRIIGYCTNALPGESWDEVFRNLQVWSLEMRASLAGDFAFGIGLRLSAVAAREVLAPGRCAALKAFCRSAGVPVFTLNGFPLARIIHEDSGDTKASAW